MASPFTTDSVTARLGCIAVPVFSANPFTYFHILSRLADFGSVIWFLLMNSWLWTPVYKRQAVLYNPPLPDFIANQAPVFRSPKSRRNRSAKLFADFAPD